MVIIKLHPTHSRVRARQSAERRHTTSIHIERADGEKIEEQSIRGLGRVGDVLGECGMVGDGVEGGRVEFGKSRVGILAMEAFLVAINPV